MHIPAAYLSVIFIWSTTPLAVKWSGEGGGFLFGVTGRMLLGAVIMLVVLKVNGLRLLWHRQAVLAYLACSLGVFGAMFVLYWAAQFIPSGFISVLFALVPIVTSILAAFVLNERSLTLSKLLGLAIGVAGLALVFESALRIDEAAWRGIWAMLVSVVLFSASGVLVKRISAEIPGAVVNAGGLIVGTVLYLIVWAVFDGRVPESLPPRTGLAILYLAVVGTVVGFNLYIFLLKRLPTVTLHLVTLITPVSALLLGHYINGETLDTHIWSVVGLITFGLMLHQWEGLMKLVRVWR